jgi:hypothetical protein
MRLHFAMANLHQVGYFNLNEIYGLFSYHYTKNAPKFIAYHSQFKDFILDSGIFTYLNGKDTKNVDWEKYIYDYGNFVKLHNIKNYVEVDIDQIVGLKEVERLRAKLEKQVGWQSMPVWHINRGYENWLQTCTDYNYVCFGAFITDNLKEDKYPFIRKFIYDADKLDCRVHGLGMTTYKWLKQLPFYSVDSSTWIAGARFGYIQYFKDGEILNRNKQEYQKTKEGDDFIRHNAKEWVKYAHYVENYL